MALQPFGAPFDQAQPPAQTQAPSTFSSSTTGGASFTFDMPSNAAQLSSNIFGNTDMSTNQPPPSLGNTSITFTLKCMGENCESPAGCGLFVMDCSHAYCEACKKKLMALGVWPCCQHINPRFPLNEMVTQAPQQRRQILQPRQPRQKRGVVSKAVDQVQDSNGGAPPGPQFSQGGLGGTQQQPPTGSSEQGAISTSDSQGLYADLHTCDVEKCMNEAELEVQGCKHKYCGDHVRLMFEQSIEQNSRLACLGGCPTEVGYARAIPFVEDYPDLKNAYDEVRNALLRQNS